MLVRITKNWLEKKHLFKPLKYYLNRCYNVLVLVSWRQRLLVTVEHVWIFHRFQTFSIYCSFLAFDSARFAAPYSAVACNFFVLVNHRIRISIFGQTVERLCRSHNDMLTFRIARIHVGYFVHVFVRMHTHIERLNL